jgi:hypothetical protein
LHLFSWQRSAQAAHPIYAKPATAKLQGKQSFSAAVESKARASKNATAFSSRDPVVNI